MHQAQSIDLTTAAIAKLDDGIGALSSHGARVEDAGTIAQLKAASTQASSAMTSLEDRSSQVEEIVDTV